MKKIAALLMLVCIAVMPFAALAEVTSITWEEAGEPIAAQYELQGDFVNLDALGLKIWIPADLIYTETEEEGRMYLFIDKDQECYLAVDFAVSDGMTLEQAYENAVANGMTGPEIVSINGINALTYKDEANNIGQIVLVNADGEMVIFSFGPVDSEAGEIAFAVIGSSLNFAD